MVETFWKNRKILNKSSQGRINIKNKDLPYKMWIWTEQVIGCNP